jgi:hypothetical protein
MAAYVYSIYTNALATRFTEPLVQPTFLPRPENNYKVIGNIISMTGIASSSATMRLYLNGTIVQTALNATTISLRQPLMWQVTRLL